MPRIGIKKAQKRELFDEASRAMNYLSPETAEDYYFALTKSIIRLLRKRGEATLPHFGKFLIMSQKPRKIRNVNTGINQTLPEIQLVKFRADYKLREYIKLLDTK